jgi:hypothetical protein
VTRRRDFVLVSRFIGYSSVVTTINYNTLKITVTITREMTSSISVLTSRCYVTDLSNGYAVSYQWILAQEWSLQITMQSSSTQFSSANFLSNSLYDWNLLVQILNRFVKLKLKLKLK